MKLISNFYLLAATPREPYRLQAQAAQPLHQARAGAEGAERARQPQAIHSAVMMKMIVKIRDGLIPRDMGIGIELEMILHCKKSFLCTVSWQNIRKKSWTWSQN